MDRLSHKGRMQDDSDDETDDNDDLIDGNDRRLINDTSTIWQPDRCINQYCGGDSETDVHQKASINSVSCIYYDVHSQSVLEYGTCNHEYYNEVYIWNISKLLLA